MTNRPRFDPNNTTDSQELRLRPWGRIQGRLLSKESPAAYRILGFRIKQDDPAYADMINIVDRTTTDLNGQFDFDHVPPGDIEIIELKQPGDTDDRSVVLTRILQEPAKSTTLTITRPENSL